MAGETILIVEDVPESLKFTAGVLRGAGYKVHIASTAEQAMSTLRFLQPRMVLVDFLLPGMSGLELTAKIRQDNRLQNTLVVALTACSTADDEIKAQQAGCAAYLTKPISGTELASRVHDLIEYGGSPSGENGHGNGTKQDGENPLRGLPDEELAELRDSFLRGGKGVSRQILLGLDDGFDDLKTLRTVHQWIGTAGLLDFPNVAHRARDVEHILRMPPWTASRLRGPLTNLARAFYHPAAPESEGPSQASIRVLAGKRVALIGLSGDEAERMCTALEHVRAKPRLFEADQSPYSETVSICDLVCVHVRPGNVLCRWLAREAPGLPAVPTVFLGAPEHLAALDASIHERTCMLITDGCLEEEVLMRLRLALTQKNQQPAAVAGGGTFLVAVSDGTVRAPLKKKLEDHGMTCRMAESGPETILLLRDVQPSVAVLDVNMDGFEVMASIRAESLPVRTVFLTYQPHEDEILRGFSLGAEDYLAEPFSPTELVARLKRFA